MSRWHLLRIVKGLLCAAALTSAAEDHLTIESIRERVSRLRPLVEEALDVRLGPFEVRAVTQEELREIDEKDLREQLSANVDDSDTAANVAASYARVRCRNVLARVTSGPCELQVCPENLLRISELTPEYSRVLHPSFLDVLLIHELVHVAQPMRPEALTIATSLEGRQVLRAVYEGHAQYVTRKIAARRNLAEALELLVAVVEGTPAGTADREAQESPIAPRGYAYSQGERFVTVVAGALGEREATRRIFADPPRDLRAIDRPEIYLDPTSDAPLRKHAEQLRSRVEELWEQRFGRQSQGISQSNLALRAFLGWLGPDEAARAATLFREGFLVVRSQYAQDTYVRMLLCEDAEKARDLYDRLARSLRREDEWLSNEASGVARATYRPSSDAYWERSLAYSKRIDRGTTQDRVGMIGLREYCVLECALDGEETPSFLLDRIVWEVGCLLEATEQAAPWSNKIGSDALEEIRRSVDDPDPRIRWRAAQDIARMPLADGLKRKALLPWLQDKDARVRAAAVRPLLHAGWCEVAVEENVAALLRDPDPDVATLAIANLSRCAGLTQPAKLRFVLQALRSECTDVVLEAQEWLRERNLQNEIPIDHYVELGSHPDPRVRAATLRTLRGSDIGRNSRPDPRIRESVLAALRSDANCRAQAASLLSSFGRDWWDEAMLGALLERLKEDRGLLGFVTWSALETVPPALVEAHAGRFREPVAAVLRSSGAMRALHALQVHRSLLPPHSATVAELARNGDGGTRAEAVLALHAGGRRDEFVMEALLAGLKGPMGSRLARALLEWAPDTIPDSAVPVLIEALRCGDGSLRISIATVLGHVGSRAVDALPLLDSLARENGARREFAEAAKAIRAGQRTR